jgi:bacterioferritin-associated ferredoxin
LSVDLVVFGDRSPNLDLVLAAGAAVERQGDTLVPVLDGDGRTTVPTLSVVGSATGRQGARHEAADHPHPDAMVCFCEDVRVREIRDELAAGYRDPELVKRRTGALTGPCQGKSCLQAFACVAGSDDVPTARPPLRPIRLGDLVPPP